MLSRFILLVLVIFVNAVVITTILSPILYIYSEYTDGVQVELEDGFEY